MSMRLSRLIAVLACLSLLSTKVGAAIGLEEGFRPPNFAAADLNGNRQDISSRQGKVVVLHFWATWCPYCRGEIDELVKLHSQWASKGVEVVSVSTDEDVAALKGFVARTRLPYPVIADAASGSSIAGRYAITGIPVTYIINRKGVIAEVLPGSSEIIEAVEAVLQQG